MTINKLDLNMTVVCTPKHVQCNDLTPDSLIPYQCQIFTNRGESANDPPLNSYASGS